MLQQDMTSSGGLCDRSPDMAALETGSSRPGETPGIRCDDPDECLAVCRCWPEKPPRIGRCRLHVTVTGTAEELAACDACLCHGSRT